MESIKEEEVPFLKINENAGQDIQTRKWLFVWMIMIVTLSALIFFLQTEMRNLTPSSNPLFFILHENFAFLITESDLCVVGP